MHREVGDHIEEILAGGDLVRVQKHLDECVDCREGVHSMQDQAAMLRALKPPEDFDAEPCPGFYARVMERIEAEGPISIWNLFIESAFGRRIAVAAFALALLLGVYLVSSEQTSEEPLVAGEGSQFVLSPSDSVQPQAQPVSQAQWATGMPVDPFAGQADPFLTEMNQFVTHMEPGSSDGDVLADLGTYREQ